MPVIILIVLGFVLVIWGAHLLVDVTYIASGAAKPWSYYLLGNANSLQDEKSAPKQDAALGILSRHLEQGLGNDVLLLGQCNRQGVDGFDRRDYNSHWTHLGWGWDGTPQLYPNLPGESSPLADQSGSYFLRCDSGFMEIHLAKWSRR